MIASIGEEPPLISWLADGSSRGRDPTTVRDHGVLLGPNPRARTSHFGVAD